MPMKKKKVKKKKRPKRNINADASSASLSSKTNPKINSTSPNHINRTKEEPMVIPTLDDFFEFILTDQSGTFGKTWKKILFVFDNFLLYFQGKDFHHIGFHIGKCARLVISIMI